MPKNVGTTATQKRPQTSLMMRDVKSVLASINRDLAAAEKRTATYQGQQKAAVMVLIVEKKLTHLGAGIELMDRETVGNLLKKYTLFQHFSHILSMEFPRTSLSIDIPY